MLGPCGRVARGFGLAGAGMTAAERANVDRREREATLRRAVTLTRTECGGFRSGHYFADWEAGAWFIYDTRRRLGGFRARLVATVPTLTAVRQWVRDQADE